MALMNPPLIKPSPSAAHSGASMDRMLPQPSRRQRQLPRVALAMLAISGLALLVWQRAPRIQLVDSPQLARVAAGEFRDELSLRARVEPIRSIQLDAAEAGRVEAVFVHDGDWVEADAPLYRLDSPDEEQLLMQRSAEVAQQMANVSVQRSAQAASLAQNRRELVQLQAAQQQAESDYQRLAKFASSGFVSAAALEHAQRQQQLTSQLLQQAQHDQRIEADTRQQSLDEMARAVQGLQRGLQLLQRSRDRLQQRAPIAGQLSGFQLQIGTSVRPGDRLGRIDDPTSGVQLAADVDEFYLPRLHTGQMATSSSGTLTVAQTLPQVQGGKVRVLLRWTDGTSARADLRPGQAVDLRLQLSPPAPALLLPDGPGVQTRLYVHRDNQLQRRTVRLGRRAAGQVEVLAGLRAGDEVLISQPPSDVDRFALP
ncbi:MAG: efflux RND transporter periplasmic adaptor subunit [Steroidobacteraceae bacterium]